MRGLASVGLVCGVDARTGRLRGLEQFWKQLERR